jgi:hypothetical protein
LSLAQKPGNRLETGFDERDAGSRVHVVSQVVHRLVHFLILVLVLLLVIVEDLVLVFLNRLLVVVDVDDFGCLGRSTGGL